MDQEPVEPSATVGSAEVVELAQLAPGAPIEAVTSRGVVYRGFVDDVAPTLGVIWVRLDGLGERVLLNREEHTFWSPRPAGDGQPG